MPQARHMRQRWRQRAQDRKARRVYISLCTHATMIFSLSDCTFLSNYDHVDLGGSTLELSEVNASVSEVVDATVVLREGNGTPVTGQLVTLHAANCAANLAPLTTDQLGRAGFQITAKEAGQCPITASVTIGTETYAVGSAASILFLNNSSGTVTGGTALNVVASVHERGELDIGYTGAVQFTSSDPFAVLPGFITMTLSDRGLRELVAAAVLQTPGQQTINAVDKATGNVLHVDTYNVTAGGAASLVLSGVPSESIAGQTFSPTVSAVNAAGVPDPNYRGVVRWQSNDASTLTPGTYTFVAADAGTHVFSNALQFSTAGTQVVSVSDRALASTLLTTSVSAGAVSKLHIVSVSTIPAGEALLMSVRAEDAYGNPQPNYTGTAAFSSSDLQASLPNAYAYLQQDIGAKDFGVVLRTAGNQNVSVTDTLDASICGGTQLSIQPVQAARFVLSFPPLVQVGVGYKLTITAQDLYGNTATSYRGTVRTQSSDPQGVMPADTNFTAADAGVLQLSVTLRSTGNQVLNVTDTAQSSLSAELPSISATAGPAASLSMQLQQTQVSLGKPMLAVLTAMDVFGNTATSYAGTIKLSSSDPAAVLPLNYAYTSNDAGRHTFSITPNTLGAQTANAVDVGGTVPSPTQVSYEVLCVTGLATMGGITSQEGGSACALLSNNSVKCWGEGGGGQLGMGDFDDRGTAPSQMGQALPAVSLGTGRTARHVSVGDQFSCAILDTGALKCWGDNSLGNLGLGDLSSRGGQHGQMGDSLPVIALGAGRTASDIKLGPHQACTVLDTGAIVCWGSNSALEDLGIAEGSQDLGSVPATAPSQLPAVNLGTGRTVASMSQLGGFSTSGHRCAVLDTNQLVCWGRNWAGQLGLGDVQDRGTNGANMGSSLPAVSLGTGLSAKKVAAGYAHTCASLNNAQVKCWGAQFQGSLGLGDTQYRGNATNQMGDNLPVVNLGTGRSAVDITVGLDYTCALLDTHQLKCWGTNGAGQLGLGDTIARGSSLSQMGDSLPVVALGTGRSASKIQAANSFACALLDDATVKCWGENAHGQLGQGDTYVRGASPSSLGDALSPIVLW